MQIVQSLHTGKNYCRRLLANPAVRKFFCSMIAETTIGALRAQAHAGRHAILFLISVGSSVTLFEARGIKSVKVAMGIGRMSWRRGTARRNRYCAAVPDGQKGRENQGC